MALDAPTFLTYEQLVAEVARYTYRPGWTLTVFDHRFDGPVLQIETTVPNSYHPDQPVTLRINSPLPPIPDAEYLAHYLLQRLLRIESHECREWLRRDQCLVSDPHRPLDADR